MIRVTGKLEIEHKSVIIDYDLDSLDFEIQDSEDRDMGESIFHSATLYDSEGEEIGDFEVYEYPAGDVETFEISMQSGYRVNIKPDVSIEQSSDC